MILKLFKLAGNQTHLANMFNPLHFSSGNYHSTYHIWISFKHSLNIFVHFTIPAPFSTHFHSPGGGQVQNCPRRRRGFTLSVARGFGFEVIGRSPTYTGRVLLMSCNIHRNIKLLQPVFFFNRHFFVGHLSIQTHFLALIGMLMNKNVESTLASQHPKWYFQKNTTNWP